MIALRPIYGRFGTVKITILEGRRIHEQILKLLDVEQMLKNKEIGYEKGEKKIEPVKKTVKEDTEK